ncbi:MAG: phytanoyl-CoA dioxygenase family protein [Burkholderiales bacterium]|nr:phytanoyl-CoA dioxygenase family protein [Burkholderiales bacterium]
MAPLNAEEVRRYAADGIVVPRTRLAADTVTGIRERVEAFLRDQNIRDSDYVPDIIEKDPGWLRYAVLPEILDVVRQLIGDDVIVWGSALFCKAARGGKATPWHQDGHYWPITPLATVTAWIAFDNVDTGNGCLRVIPGSHAKGQLFAHDANNSDTIILNQVIRQEHLKTAEPMDIVLEPGMFSVHDVYLIHGANPNESGRRRGGMVFRYMPATSYFDRELAAKQVREMGVLDLSRRKLHLVSGVDASGKNDIYQPNAR